MHILWTVLLSYNVSLNLSLTQRHVSALSLLLSRIYKTLAFSLVASLTVSLALWLSHTQGCVSVSLCVCQNENIENFWWNENIKDEIFRTSPTLNKQFWGEVSKPPEYRSGPKTARFCNIHLLPEYFCPTGAWHTFFKTLDPRLEKLGSKILIFWGRAKYIGVWMCGYQQKSLFFGIWDFLHNIGPQQ